MANHGFGGIFGLNVFALGATFDSMDLDRPVTVLTHQIAWTLKVDKVIEAFGSRPAFRQAALDVFAPGHHVLVLPGGDLDAFNAFDECNRIVLGALAGDLVASRRPWPT